MTYVRLMSVDQTPRIFDRVDFPSQTVQEYFLMIDVAKYSESESESVCVVETNPRKYPDGDQPFIGPIFLRERARDFGKIQN